MLAFQQRGGLQVGLNLRDRILFHDSAVESSKTGLAISREEFQTTRKLLAAIASAANSGVSNPVRANGIATALYKNAQPMF